MEIDDLLVDGLRAASVVAVVLLTAILGFLLPQPGYRTSRLVLFAIVACFAWVGAIGAVRRRLTPVLVGAAAQFLLGFWNFTIGLALLPTSVVLLATGLALRADADR